MRRFAIFAAGAALVFGSLAIPGMAVANGRTATPDSNTSISAQSVSLDAPITAQGHGHGRDGYRRGYRHGYSDGRHGYYGHRGGRCYGCDGPGSRCDRRGCAYGGPYYDGYYGGGYGCGYDYPCSQPYQYNCSKYTGRDGAAPPPESGCKYDQKCDCYYHTSEPPQSGQPGPGPDQSAQPGPDDSGQPPAPDQGGEPAPGPDQGGQPRPY